MVFDENGKQIPEFQDSYSKVEDKLLKATEGRNDIIFESEKLGEGITQVSREQFFGLNDKTN